MWFLGESQLRLSIAGLRKKVNTLFYGIEKFKLVEFSHDDSLIQNLYTIALNMS